MSDPRQDPHWGELVDRGKQLLGKQSGLQWDWGDLALEVEPMAADRERGDSGEWAGAELERLSAWAKDIGFEEQTGKSFGTLRNYRSVASRWPSARRRAEVNFSVHQALAYHHDRFELIKQDGLTYESAVALARGDHIPRGSLAGHKPLTRVAVRLSQARASLITALDGIRLGEFHEDEQARELLKAELELIETAFGWIKTFIETGSVDQEFEDVLARVRGKSK